ncbi:hypothetical protein GALMADRAFT_243946 [Galerina marginata CBS 339.88]|uniref:Uncharacterized protein n=1 Tax=Galerina marginata (strain CBS 339.88) TaxID=685588 RepID=A0A067T5T8_GALM3|nr:hypothetical protein GALMADRAFT_243946 [Galerina marginata CBS 339.88]
MKAVSNSLPRGNYGNYVGLRSCIRAYLLPQVSYLPTTREKSPQKLHCGNSLKATIITLVGDLKEDTPSFRQWVHCRNQVEVRG